MAETATEQYEKGIASRLADAKGLIQSGRSVQAAAEMEELLTGELESLDENAARYLLAVARRYSNDYPGAIAAADALIDADAGHARAHQERGYSLLAMNRPDEAARAFGQAVSLNPGLISSWKVLTGLYARAGRADAAAAAKQRHEYLASLPDELVGVIDLMHEGRLLRAERLCRDFLRRHKQHIEGMRLLAELAIRLRIYDDAEFLLESCVEFAPDNVQARSDYLGILNRKCKFQNAAEQAEILLNEQPENPAFLLGMGNALVGIGRIEEGIAFYEKGIERTANKSGAHVMLGHAQKALGRLDDAIAAYRTAYRLKPNYGDAYWSLANIKTYRFTDHEIDDIVGREGDPAVAADDRIHLCFAAGKACEDRGDYEASFQFYSRGNELKLSLNRYRPETTSSMVQAQVDTCTAELFEARTGVGFDAPDPIFIVGLPRAGSTLLEQILASHSMVDGTMELHNILGLAQRLSGRTSERDGRYPAILTELDEMYFRRFGEQFVANTRVYRGGAPYFIDKMPNNFFHVGLIRLILPNAKVIDARRHPMACCFSAFKQLFGEGQDFSYGLEALGQYYADYVRLMDHWDDVLPGFVLRVNHEDVVDDLESAVRRLLEFCGLPFEQSCLDYYRTERNIRTPSSEQVRQPIYRSGLYAWRNFERWLEPLRDSLGPVVRARYGLN